jgi:alpha-L-fucosidase 2
MKSYIKTLFVSIFLLQLCSCQKERARPAQQIIGKYKTVFTQPPERIPVPRSVDAPMMGNGFTGVAISGEPEKQVYYLARNDFWRLKSSYNQSFPAVLGKVEVDIPELKKASYRIEQDLYSAITWSTFTKENCEVQYKAFVSATEDLMVLEISLSGEEKLQGTITLQLPGKQEFVDNPPLDLIFPTVTDSGKSTHGVYFISRAFEEDVDIPTRAACAFKILDNESNRFELSEGNPVTIAFAFSSNFKSDDCVQDVIARVARLNRKEIEEIESKHEAWWADFWSKSYVDINDSIIEKQYYLSNYSMASFSRDKDFPPSIFGTCVTKERPAWSGDYHLNYNHFAPYYGLFSSNHVEQAVPCNISILAQQKRGEYYSKKVCGIEGGIMLPVGAGPLGIETTRRNKLMEEHRTNYIENGNVEDEGLFWGQKSNSAYSVVNMTQHFYTTYDRKYTEMYYPYIKGVATFWENYLSWEDGRYVIYNDAIHEGTVGTMNPILSLGLVRLVMQTAIDMSKELDMDAGRTEKWQHIIDNLSDYSYQERDGKKVFRYTEKGIDWWRNNTLGIQHIYPAGQIGLDSDPELLQVARNTIDVMQRWIDFNGSNSFFPAAVRVGYNPDTILSQLHNYVNNTYPNGFQLNNPHGIENFSTVPNTINEMLCMGHGGVLRIFPVWPKDKDARFYNIRTHGAFLVSSEQKNGQVMYVDIVSEKGKTCTVKNPWPGNKVRLMRNGKQSEMLEGEVISFRTSENESIKLSL